MIFHTWLRRLVFSCPLCTKGEDRCKISSHKNINWFNSTRKPNLVHHCVCYTPRKFGCPYTTWLRQMVHMRRQANFLFTILMVKHVAQSYPVNKECLCPFFQCTQSSTLWCRKLNTWDSFDTCVLIGP